MVGRIWNDDFRHDPMLFSKLVDQPLIIIFMASFIAQTMIQIIQWRRHRAMTRSQTERRHMRCVPWLRFVSRISQTHSE